MPPGVATRGRGQLGAGRCSMSAARCSTMQRVVLLGGNSWREQPDVAGCRQGAAACGRVPHGCSRVPPGAGGCSGSIARREQLGLQRGAAGCGRARAGAAGCSQVQQGGAAVCRQVRHGCSRAQPGAAECSRSLSTRKQLTKSKKCVALGENSSQSDQTAKYSS